MGELSGYWPRISTTTGEDYFNPHKSDETGRSMAQVAQAWFRYRSVPVIPIVGARKLSQLQDNLASFDLALSAEQVKVLDEARQIDLGFPYHL